MTLHIKRDAPRRRLYTLHVILLISRYIMFFLLNAFDYLYIFKDHKETNNHKDKPDVKD